MNSGRISVEKEIHTTFSLSYKIVQAKALNEYSSLRMCCGILRALGSGVSSFFSFFSFLGSARVGSCQAEEDKPIIM